MLDHRGFQVFETAAIARYLDEGFEGPALQPIAAPARARMAQVIAIADGRAYWPFVRQVYAGGVFRPSEGFARDEAAIAAGLAAAIPVLSVFGRIARQGNALLPGGVISLGDLHPAPMIAAFCAAPEGADLLVHYPDLLRWWHSLRHQPAVLATETGLPDRE